MTEKTKHTPGPWSVEAWISPSKGGVLQVGAFSEGGNRTLCCVVESFNKFDDARLIAAAPDMLEALKKLASIDFGSNGWDDFAENVAREARAAIAKATEESETCHKMKLL